MGSTDLLLLDLDCAFDKSAWHGTTLKGALRGLDPETALWRPAPDRHNIWEELLHCAYWKYIARRHVARAEVEGFPRSPSNWPAPPPEATRASLRADIALLQNEHAALRQAVAEFPAKRLGDRPTAKGPTFAKLILGVAAHDLYHTGQIQLLKRLIARG